MISDTSIAGLSDSTQRMAESPVIDVRGLSRAFGRSEAVHDLNFTVRPGSVYGFFGRNGAGKTTTIKCLLNLLRPTAGSVRLFGLDPARDEVAVKRRIVYVPDSAAFYPWMTVRQTLDYFASFRGGWPFRTSAEPLRTVAASRPRSAWPFSSSCFWRAGSSAPRGPLVTTRRAFGRHIP